METSKTIDNVIDFGLSSNRNRDRDRDRDKDREGTFDPESTESDTNLDSTEGSVFNF